MTETATPKPSPIAKGIVVGCGLLCLAFVVIVIMAIATVPDSAERVSSTPAPAAKPTGLPITAFDLWRHYENNEIAADKAYKGRWLTITGQIDDIGTDLLNTPFVTFRRSSQIFSVQAMFTRGRDEDLLAGFNRMQTITITCRGSGKLGNVIVRDCFVP